MAYASFLHPDAGERVPLRRRIASLLFAVAANALIFWLLWLLAPRVMPDPPRDPSILEVFDLPAAQREVPPVTRAAGSPQALAGARAKVSAPRDATPPPSPTVTIAPAPAPPFPSTSPA